MGHCWVKVKGKVVDVTATQFGDYPPVLVLPTQKYSKLEFVKQFDTKLLNKKGVENLMEYWPEEQTPWAYYEKIYRHFGLSI